MASPSYMAMTYSKDPVEHAFNFTKRAEEGMGRRKERKERESVSSFLDAFAHAHLSVSSLAICCLDCLLLLQPDAIDPLPFVVGHFTACSQSSLMSCCPDFTA